MRLAEPVDVPRLWHLCEVAHADNGAFSLSPAKVITLLKRAAWRSGDPPAVIGLIDGPDRIEAAICLDAIQHWYSDQWFWCDRFAYVHPAHRRSRHAFRLLQFCRAWYETAAKPMGTVIVVSIETLHSLGAKERLYGRYARRVGASFVFGEMPMERTDAECARVAAAKQ